MSRIVWLKIGAVAALWTIIAAAAASGWLIGRGEAARQITDLQHRLALGTPSKQTCGVEIQLLEARAGKPAPSTNLFGLTLDGIWLGAPRHLHLREMLTSR